MLARSRGILPAPVDFGHWEQTALGLSYGLALIKLDCGWL